MNARFALAFALGLIWAPLAAAADGPSPGLEAGQVLRGRFVQERHLKGFKAPLRSEGHFVLAPGRGLIWRAEKPFAVTTAITAAGLVQQAGGAETLRLPSSRLPFLARLYDMLGGALAGDWRALGGDFTVARSGDDKRWQVALIPRNTDDLAMPFRSIAIAGDRFVEHVEMTKPDGDTEGLTFFDQTLSTLAADDAAALDDVGK